MKRTVCCWMVIIANAYGQSQYRTNTFGELRSPSDFERFEETERKALRGDAEAQCDLGAFYTRGVGTKLDLNAAREWFQRAANQGNARGCLLLGGSYSTTVGWEGGTIHEDPQECFRWYLRAAQLGSLEGAVAVAMSYDVGNIRTTADRSGEGIFKVGSLNPKRRVAPNLHEARRWYQTAAQRGDKTAIINLGVMLWFGQGGPTDQLEAYKYFRLAAKEGSTIARENLECAGRYLREDVISEATRRAEEWHPTTTNTVSARVSR